MKTKMCNNFIAMNWLKDSKHNSTAKAYDAIVYIWDYNIIDVWKQKKVIIQKRHKIESLYELLNWNQTKVKTIRPEWIL